MSFLKGFSVQDAQICLKQILRSEEFWSFQYKSSSMIPVKSYLDDEAHFFLAELLQKYNLYLLIMNVTTKMLEEESWKSKNWKDIHLKFWQLLIIMT